MEKQSDEEAKVDIEKFDVEITKENECPDGGWGWVVTVACGIVRASTKLFSPFGLLFSGVLLQIGASSITTAWIYNLFMVMEQFAKFFVGPFGDVFGWRMVVVSSGIMLFLSALALIFVSSVAHLIVFFSIGIGVSSGLAVYTTQVVVPSYFDKNRGKAMALMLIGVCIGQFISPIIITFLMETYGYKGTMLIISSLLLNVCAAGTVMHPIEWHLQPPHGKCVIECKEVTAGIANSAADAVQSSSRMCPRNPKVFLVGMVTQRVWIALKENLKALKCHCVIILSLNVASYLAGYVNFAMMIPFKMQDDGYSLKEASYCLSAMAIASGVSRIASPFLSDGKKFNKKSVYIFGIAGAFVSIFGFTLAPSLRWMIVLSSCVGFFNGIVISLYTLVMIDVLGMKLFKSCFGISGIFIGISSIAVGPLLGLVRDISGSYDLTMRLSAGVVIISFLLILSLPKSNPS